MLELKKQSEVLERLKKMLSGTYSYMGKVRTLLHYKMDGNEIIIKTNKQDIHTRITRLPEVLDNMMPIRDSGKPNKLAVSEGAMEFQRNQGSKLDGLQDTLMAAMERVEKDSDYIDQAKAISGLATNVISMTKVKIDLMKMMKSEEL